MDYVFREAKALVYILAGDDNLAEYLLDGYTPKELEELSEAAHALRGMCWDIRVRKLREKNDDTRTNGS